MKSVFALIVAISIFAGQPSLKGAQTPPKLTAIVTEAQVQRWLKIWQKRLSLEDWDITAHIVRSRELKPDTLGNLRWNSTSKTAVVRLMDPFDYDLPPEEIPSDMEYTVVHELVHLQLATIPKAAGSKDVEERVVNGIGEALFALEKGSRYRPRAAVAHVSAPKDKSAFEASRAAK
jgi:hypothetical protein